jgi:hypothetical protein
VDTLGTTFVQPFQGPQGAENALKLASVLAPRINLGSRPLQAGEGEGLRHLLGAFGGFAEQKRRKEAEGNVLTGLEGALSGKAPWSSLPISDLPEATQRMIMEEVAKGAQRQNPSVADRLAALSHAMQIQQQGGDPNVAFASMGLPAMMRSPVSPDRVGMSPETTMTPSLNRLPPATMSPFGLTKVQMERQMPPKTPGEIEARAIEAQNLSPAGVLSALQRQAETPVTLQQDLNHALQGIQAKETQLFGGVSSTGIYIPPMPGSLQQDDVVGLLKLKSRAQTVEDQLAKMQGRAPVPIYDQEAIVRLRNDWYLNYKRLPTPEQLYREYAKELILNRGSQTESQ